MLGLQVSVLRRFPTPVPFTLFTDWTRIRRPEVIRLNLEFERHRIKVVERFSLQLSQLKHLDSTLNLLNYTHFMDCIKTHVLMLLRPTVTHIMSTSVTKLILKDVRYLKFRVCSETKTGDPQKGRISHSDCLSTGVANTFDLCFGINSFRHDPYFTKNNKMRFCHWLSHRVYFPGRVSNHTSSDDSSSVGKVTSFLQGRSRRHKVSTVDTLVRERVRPTVVSGPVYTSLQDRSWAHSVFVQRISSLQRAGLTPSNHCLGTESTYEVCVTLR